MALAIPIKRITLHPPEIFVQAKPVDLAGGVENTIAIYKAVEYRPYIAAAFGLSFARYDDLKFSADVDGVIEAIRILNLGAVKGLDYEEEIRIPFTREMVQRIYAPTAVTAYQLRHKILVVEPTTAIKVVLGLPLTNQDRKLEEKYRIRERIAIQVPIPFNPYEGIERIYSVGSVLTESGAILSLPVPTDQKIILLDIAAHRPTASGQAYIKITRDGIDLPELDLYCMQGLEAGIGLNHRYAIRVVALETLDVELDVKVSGTYRVRAVYGIGRLTIPEKIKWGIDLTPEEEDIAVKEDLYDRVKAGIV